LAKIRKETEKGKERKLIIQVLKSNYRLISNLGRPHKLFLKNITKGKIIKRAIKKSSPQLTISFPYHIFNRIKKLSIKKTRGKKTIANVKKFNHRIKSAIKQ
jgi:hypothetical protein